MLNWSYKEKCHNKCVHPATSPDLFASLLVRKLAVNVICIFGVVGNWRVIQWWKHHFFGRNCWTVDKLKKDYSMMFCTRWWFVRSLITFHQDHLAQRGALSLNRSFSSLMSISLFSQKGKLYELLIRFILSLMQHFSWHDGSHFVAVFGPEHVKQFHQLNQDLGSSLS